MLLYVALFFMQKFCFKFVNMVKLNSKFLLKFMTKNREKLESRILQILGYIKNEELLALFRENPSIFSDEDLVLVLNFLETGENNFL
jgi:hypothetical protein